LYTNYLYFVNNKRSVLSLPNPSSIRKWISNVNASAGFLSDVLTEIGKFSDENKYCCLILDSMSIKKKTHWDRANHRYLHPLSCLTN